MARTVYLHLGIHKTGTTAIQNVCMANHDKLKRAGILFPRSGFIRQAAVDATDTPGHRGLLRFLKEPSKTPLHPAGLHLLGEIEASRCNRIVISSEVLSAPHNSDAVNGVSWLRKQGFHVKIIVYLRRQDSWLDSFYRERLKWNGAAYPETRSIEEFWLAEGDNWLNYRERIGLWRDAVGAENAVIRSYEDVQEGRGVVVDFLDVIGVDDALLDVLQSREAVHNLSLPPSAVDLLRAFNGLPDLGRSCKHELISAIRQMELFTRSTGSLISPRLWGELESAYGEENEELRLSWLSGPSERLSFFTGPPQRSFSEQAISYADSTLLIGGLLRAVGQPLHGETAKLSDSSHRAG